MVKIQLLLSARHWIIWVID